MEELLKLSDKNNVVNPNSIFKIEDKWSKAHYGVKINVISSFENYKAIKTLCVIQLFRTLELT